MPQAKPAPKPRHAAPPPSGAAGGHAFKGLQDWIEVFTAGTHTDSKGRVCTFSADDLDQMAGNVGGSGVPAVLGHPEADDPAYAWGQLKRDGGSLFAKFGDINPDFEAGVDSGAYRERSVSVFKDPTRGWVVRHVGWLGAAAPAIAGLKPLTYRAAPTPAGDADLHEFGSSGGAMDAGWAFGDVARLLRGLRDYLIGDKGLDTADKVLPDWTITSISEAGRRMADASTTASAPVAFSHSDDSTGDTSMPTTITEADLQRARDEAARTATEAAQAQFSAQGQELADLRAQRQTERIGVQINGWKAAGLLLPAEEPGLAEFMAALEGGQAAEFQFSAADKSAAKKTPASWFADFVAARKPIKLGVSGIVDANAPASVDTQDYRAIAKAAMEFASAEAAAGRVVSVAQAVAHVTTTATRA